MAKPFGLVDEKLAEADFFLNKLSDERCGPFEARCYFSAFVAAARSVTFALQSAMGDTPGFMEWYEEKRAQLKADPLARFFHQARTDSQHIGLNPVNAGYSSAAGGRRYFFSNTGDGKSEPNVPQEDVASASRKYMRTIVRLIQDCYRDWGRVMDPDQYYTMDNLKALGITLEDIEESQGLPRGYTAIAVGSPEMDEQRLKALRRAIPMASRQWAFEKYLTNIEPEDATVPQHPWGGAFPTTLQSLIKHIAENDTKREG